MGFTPLALARRWMLRAVSARRAAPRLTRVSLGILLDTVVIQP